MAGSPDEIRANPGPQEAFLATAADIAVFGGSAGCGKTRGLLLLPIQYVNIPEFAAVIFRRSYPEIMNPGGLWDDAAALYTHLRAEPKLTTLEWSFQSGARVKFGHMQYEADRFAWRGAQIPMIAFDQLENFSELMFWSMLHPNRDPSGKVRPFLRGTCNPVPADDVIGGWLHRLVSWWLDERSGYARWDRSGVVRWFVRDGDVMHWYDDVEAACVSHPGAQPTSLTFIPGRLSDNRALLEKNPEYLAHLMALPAFERARLLGDAELGGNWNARPEAGKVFDRAKFKTVGAAPRQARRVRAWDKASVPGGGDWTAGVKIAEADGLYFVEGCARGQWSARDRNAEVLRTARLDKYDVKIWIEQEGGSGGKESAAISVQDLAGFEVRAETVTGSKLARAGAFAAQVEAGNVYVVVTGDPARDGWVEPYLAEHHAFDGSGKGHDDQVDASSLAFNKLALDAGGLQIGTLGGSERSEREPRPSVDLDALFSG